MYNEKIYDYVIESINNILVNGIEFYGKEENIFEQKLKDMYEYINSNKDITKDESIELVNRNFAKKVNMPDRVYKLITEYLRRVSDIKISILNLEDDLTLYHSNVIEFNNKSNDQDISSKTNDNMNMDDNKMKSESVCNIDVDSITNDNKKSILDLFR